MTMDAEMCECADTIKLANDVLDRVGIAREVVILNGRLERSLADRVEQLVRMWEHERKLQIEWHEIAKRTNDDVDALREQVRACKAALAALCQEEP